MVDTTPSFYYIPLMAKKLKVHREQEEIRRKVRDVLIDLLVDAANRAPGSLSNEIIDSSVDHIVHIVLGD